MNIGCVLRTGGDFGPEHVEWLKAQCEKYIPHEKFYCFSDCETYEDSYQLWSNWPKWWAKMEIYGAEWVKGPTLIMDLDTVILGEFKPTEEQLKNSYVMRHFTRNGFNAPEEFACGVMLTTEEFRRKVYDHFFGACGKPHKYMEEANYDDQRYFKKYWEKDLLRFQDDFPDAFVSYKLHVLQHGLSEDNVFVNFHGLPRPWDVKEDWIPCLFQASSLHQVE
jgi:hypothetical protein